MNEFRCGTCGWGATARTVEGMLAASKHHRKTGCEYEQRGESDANAEFIAHAREDVPRLVGMLRRVLDRDALARVMARGLDGTDDFDEWPVDYRDEFLEAADAVIAYIEGTETGK